MSKVLVQLQKEVAELRERLDRQETRGMYAVVVSVEERYAGSQLVGDHAAGVEALQIADSSGLAQSGTVNVGGTIVNRQLVGGDVLAYTAKTDTDDPDGSAPNDTLVLTAPTVNSYLDRAPVTLTPLRAYKVALVVIDGEGPAIEARVSHPMHDRLDEGQRQDGAGEIVFVKQRHGELGLIVTDVLGRQPKVDAGYLDPAKSMTPETLKLTHAEHEDVLAGAVPPSAFGDGPANADVDWLGRFKSNAFETTAQGTIARKNSGAAQVFIHPDGATHLGAERGNFDSLESRQTLLAGPTTGAAGGDFILQDAGILDPPAQPPITDYNWLTIDLDLPATVRPQNLTGLAMKSDTEADTLRVSDKGQVRILSFNPTTGGSITQNPLTGAPSPAEIVSIDYSSHVDLLQTLEYDTAAQRWLIRYYDWTTLAFDHEWVVTELGAASSPRPVHAVTGVGGLHEFTRVCRADATGTIDIHRYSDEVFVATTTTTDAFPWTDLQDAACLGGVLLITGPTNMIADASTWPGIKAGTPVIPVITFGFGVPPLAIGDTLGYLQVANGDLAAAGLGAIDSDLNFRTWYKPAGSKLLAQQSNVVRAGGFWTGVTYLDSITGHETVMSDPVLEDKVPGANVTYTIGAPPPGSAADSMRVYFAVDAGAGVPPLTDFWMQETSIPGEWHASVFDVNLTGTNPPATGNIPSGAAFAIKDALGTVLVDGTGYVAGGGGILGVDDDIYLGSDYIEITGRV